MNTKPSKGRAIGFRDQGPCLNCEKRAPACHDKCTAYIEFKRKHEERKARERKNRADYNAVNNFKAVQICRASNRKMRER